MNPLSRTWICFLAIATASCGLIIKRPKQVDPANPPGCKSETDCHVTVAWDPDPANEEVLGYRIYYGTSSGNYPSSVDVGNVIRFELTGLGEGTWYFAVTTYNAAGESSYSSEVSYTLTFSP